MDHGVHLRFFEKYAGTANDFPESSEAHEADIVMCMTGIGNTRRDYERLLEALEEIVAKLGEKVIGLTSEETICVGRQTQI